MLLLLFRCFNFLCTEKNEAKKCSLQLHAFVYCACKQVYVSPGNFLPESLIIFSCCLSFLLRLSPLVRDDLPPITATAHISLSFHLIRIYCARLMFLSISLFAQPIVATPLFYFRQSLQISTPSFPPRTY